MSRIIVIGSLNVDLVVRVPEHPRLGETIHGDDMAIYPGGKGANQAVAAGLLGASVSMVGRVGDDHFGSTLIAGLEHAGVESSRVIRDPIASTGTAIISVDALGENRIIISSGANNHVEPSDIDAALAELEIPDFVLLQLEIPMKTVVYAASSYHKRGAMVLLNPAPAQTLPKELLKYTDLLVPNETELSLLVGHPVDGPDACVSAARMLLRAGLPPILVTLGGDGAALVRKETTTFSPAYKVPVVDTTAAGDAFLGGLAAALAKGRSLVDALPYACAAGSLACTKMGAQPSLPNQDEVDALLNGHVHWDSTRY